eukprot:g14036.t1
MIDRPAGQWNKCGVPPCHTFVGGEEKSPGRITLKWQLRFFVEFRRFQNCLVVLNVAPLSDMFFTDRPKKYKGWCGNHGKRACVSLTAARLVVFCIRAVAPLASLRIIFLLFSWCYLLVEGSYASTIGVSWPSTAAFLWLFFDIICLIECLHLIMAFQRARQLASRQPDSFLSPDEMEEVVERVLKCLEDAAIVSGCVDPADGTRRIASRCSSQCPHAILTHWHRGASWENLTEGEANQWLAWALLNADFTEVTSDQQEVVRKVRQAMEKRTGLRFNPNPPQSKTEVAEAPLRTIRLNLDEMPWQHRPALAYLFTHALIGGFLSPLLMAWHGFRPILASEIEPRTPRKKQKSLKQLSSSPASGSGVKYWFAPAQAKQAKAQNGNTHPEDHADGIVFLHGVGVGPTPYINMISKLQKSTGLPILAVEFPQIALRWAEHTRNGTSKMMQELGAICEEQGLKRVCVIGHSYGTVVATWLIKSLPHLIQGCVLVDPISLLLFRAEVVNILYRRPDNAIEILMDYLVFKEKHLSATLARNFVWHKNIVWADQLPEQSCVVLSSEDKIVPSKALSSEDKIVPSKAVHSYLQRHGISTVWLKNLEHAGFLMHRASMQQVVQASLDVIWGRAPNLVHKANRSGSQDKRLSPVRA